MSENDNHFAREPMAPALKQKMNAATRRHLDPDGKLDPDQTLDIGELTEEALRRRQLDPACLPRGDQPLRPLAKPDCPGLIERTWNRLTQTSSRTPRG